MFKRWMSAVVVCLLAVVMLGADESGSRFNRIGHNMMCACSCGQVLLECNHVGCPDSDRMIGELRTQMMAGGADDTILGWFTAKYGPIILAAPIRGGFDRVAWIVPLALFFLGTVGTGLLIVLWKRRSGAVGGLTPSGMPSLGDDAVRERIRRETEY